MPYESLPVVRAVQVVLNRSTNADDAVTGVLEAIGDSMGWLVGGFWVPDGDDGSLRARCVWSARIHKGTDFAEETRQMRLPPGIGLPGRVWTQGETVWIEDVEQDKDFPHAAAVRIHGLLAAVGFPAGVLHGRAARAGGGAAPRLRRHRPGDRRLRGAAAGVGAAHARARSRGGRSGDGRGGVSGARTALTAGAGPR
jgi:hypothetical protein